ncbi:hypothetical protein DM860_012048 [Cuscuta australis]|uniref:Uncharacterized protein n=1 Tax=Cuscuta australis TaxID=267555 RepID=A0A328D956_9ASTE|nr:hypothetical protein DM860_012048 [Cuscuta australis]
MGKEGGGEEYLFKVVVIGDSAVGKSNLLLRFARDEFDANSKATIGVEFQTQTVEVDGGKAVKVQLWDTAGQERFRSVTSAYYRGAAGALIVYDVTRGPTFESARSWIQELNNHCDNTTTVKILVGNKCDLGEMREVSMEQGKSLAEELGLFFIETSALDSTNVTAAFDIAAREIYNNVRRNLIDVSSHSYRPELASADHRVSLAGIALSNGGTSGGGSHSKNIYSACCST